MQLAATLNSKVDERQVLLALAQDIGDIDLADNMRRLARVLSERAHVEPGSHSLYLVRNRVVLRLLNLLGADTSGEIPWHELCIVDDVMDKLPKISMQH